MAEIFPLLKLPHLAVKNVIRTMDLGEILLFINSGPEGRELFEMFIPRNSFEIGFEMKTEASIVVKYGDQQQECAIPFNRKSMYQQFFHYDEEMMTEMMKAVDGVCQKLNSGLKYVTIDGSLGQDRIPHILYWIYRRQVWIESLKAIKVLKTASVEYLLKYSSFVKKDLVLEINVTPHNTPLPKFNMDYLSLNCSSFPSGTSLQDTVPTFNCIHICLQCFSIKSTHLNQYLKKWIEGCNPRMEYLKLVFWRPKHKKIVEGIEWERQSGSYIRTYEHPKLDQPFISSGGTSIKRKDGTVATFKSNTTDHESYTFEMVVWPKNVR